MTIHHENGMRKYTQERKWRNNNIGRVKMIFTFSHADMAGVVDEWELTNHWMRDTKDNNVKKHTNKKKITHLHCKQSPWA